MSFPSINGTEVFRLPPEGYVVDFDNPKQQYALEHYLIFGIGAPVAFIALLQRFYTKIRLRKKIEVDDCFMFLGWMCSLLTQALMTASIAQRGMCSHSWEMSLESYQRYSLISYIAAPIYMLCNGFTKLSLLTYYLRISPQRFFRIAVWISIGVVSVYTIVITLMMFLVCTPPRKAFNFKVDGKCMDAAILYMATAVSNIVTDVILFILPIPTIYNLHMPRIQKAGVIVVFGIASMTVVSSVIRLVYLPVVLASTDPSWDAAPANIWTFIEGNLFVICGSTPTLRQFFKLFMPQLMGSSNRTHGVPSYGLQQNNGRPSRVAQTHNQYNQFSEGLDVELEQLPGDPKNGDRVAVRDDESNEQRDDGSERSILQTRTFTVEYSSR
ncbi:Satratoxin biosynthesis SC1 cluster protein 4 [Fusarium oxysporum f. sp. cubense]|uniref:Satratoxin biosynthesis SC1 cluster protein 4 n=1 Tax=Fusarium oxysporum f. sp. cubense TaxID=61366 RepID=A0A559LJY2_FUSOC|nr:Satratoxin biosynthesis SC1 cluster protein 4 [Fusarium oxysporum f. sp. cubense]